METTAKWTVPAHFSCHIPSFQNLSSGNGPNVKNVGGSLMVWSYLVSWYVVCFMLGIPL